MQCTQLGHSGLTVSRLALGAMTFGQYSFGAFHASVDQATADTMVGQALDAGVNLFDTAEGYGDGRSEQVLGAALRRAGARDRAIIATKVSTFVAPGGPDPDLARLSYRHVVGNAERALRRLGTSWIDLYQLHAPDFVTPWEETLRALDDLVSRGLVRYAGWSNFPAWHAALGQGIQAQRGYAPFVSAQIYYSLAGRDAEHEVLPYCRAAGLGTLIWSPLAGGFLSGKYTREDPGGGGGRRAEFKIPPVNLERGYDAVEKMRAIADARGVQVAHVAYAWLLAKPEVSSVIVGASRPEQLAENLAAASFSLTEAEVAELDALDPPAPIYPGPGLDDSRRVSAGKGTSVLAIAVWPGARAELLLHPLRPVPDPRELRFEPVAVLGWRIRSRRLGTGFPGRLDTGFRWRGAGRWVRSRRCIRGRRRLSGLRRGRHRQDLSVLRRAHGGQVRGVTGRLRNVFAQQLSDQRVVGRLAVVLPYAPEGDQPADQQQYKQSSNQPTHTSPGDAPTPENGSRTPETAHGTVTALTAYPRPWALMSAGQPHSAPGSHARRRPGLR